MKKISIKKYIYPIITSAICLLLTTALVVGNVICAANKTIITSYLCGFGFDDNSEQSIAAREKGKELAQQIEEQGAVLLKNNGVLPLEEKKVNVFGWSGSDSGYIIQGTGSGTGSRQELVTFLGGLKEAGFEYNTKLAKAYDDLNWKRVKGGSYVIEASDEVYKGYYGITEPSNSFYTDALMSEAKNFSDTAIIVLGRLMGEGNDYSKTQYIAENCKNVGEDKNRKLQSLSEREEYMIKIVTENFDKVVVVTNTGNPIEAGFADDDKIDAFIHMGYPGSRGTIGIGNILSGKVNPSGKLADTWAYNLSTAAAYATSGLEGIGMYTDMIAAYTEYRENIYSGYYWYETADKEGFWDSDFSKKRWNIEKGYEDVVQYPFGYGLSYTDFKWQVIESNVKNGSVLEKDGTINMTVRVTNVGSVDGRDVVELYYSAPYTKGGIEKSAIKLGAFAKTQTLKPGQYEDINLSMSVSEMKSYDCYDKNNNGFMGYELEAGDYTISLRTDVHTEKQMEIAGKYVVTVGEDIRYEVDEATGEVVKNQFTTYTNMTSGVSSKVNEPFNPQAHSVDGSENEGGPVKYMTRADFVASFPTEKEADRKAGKLKDDVQGIPTPVEEKSAEAPEFGVDSDLLFDDLVGADYDDGDWDNLVSQLTFTEACRFVAKSGFGMLKLSTIGFLGTKDTDGPSGFNNNVTGQNNIKAINYPCSTILAQTWDWYAAYLVGVALGVEGQALGVGGWYGPGANLHRSAMGGRNFEYYSEDGLLAGTICAYHVLGAKEKGILAYIKHIGANEDDRRREMADEGGTGCYKWMTEQTLRENVLKPFELAVKIGEANGMMSSLTRTGSMRSSGSYALLTAVLRDEWGFRGTVITDYYCFGLVNDIDEGVRAGNTQVLHPDTNEMLFDDRTSATAKKYIHKAVKDMLYAVSETQFYSMSAEGLVSGGNIGAAQDVFAWWVPVLIGVDVLSAALMGFWIFLAIRKAKMQAA